MQKQSQSESFRLAQAKRSMRFNICLLLARCFYCACYLTAALINKFNFVPLVLTGLGAVLQGVSILLQAWQIRSRFQKPRLCPRSFMAVSFTIDMLLVGLTRPDVQYVIYKLVPGIESFLGPPYTTPREHEERIQFTFLCFESVRTTQIVQIGFSYIAMFVLPAKHALVVGILGTVCYCLIAAAAQSYALSQVKFPDDFFLMACTVAMVVAVKASAETFMSQAAASQDAKQLHEFPDSIMASQA